MTAQQDIDALRQVMKAEGGGDTPPPPPTPKTRVEPVKAKEGYAVSWPNVIRIDHVYRPRLDLDWDTVPVLTLNAADKIENAEMAAVVAGKPHLAVMSDIDLQAHWRSGSGSSGSSSRWLGTCSTRCDPPGRAQSKTCSPK